MSPKQRYQTYKAAKAAIDTEDYAAALPYLRQLTDDYGDDSLLWLYRGVSTDDDAETKQSFERCLELGPISPDSRLLKLAELSMKAGEAEKAFAYVKTAYDSLLRHQNRLSEIEALKPLLDRPDYRHMAGLPATDVPNDLVSQRNYDLDYLIAQIARLHPYHERYLARPAVKAHLDHLRDNLQSWDEVGWFAKVQHLMVLLDDGHTSLYPWENEAVFWLLPDYFYEFPEGVFITQSEDEALVGARLIAIGEMPIEDVLDILADFIPRDNSQTIKWMRPEFLRYAPLLKDMGASDDPHQVTFHLCLRDGSSQTVPRMAQKGEGISIMRKLNAPSTAEAPLWLGQNTDIHWHTDLGWAHYVQFNQVRDKENETLAQFAHSLRPFLDAAQTLIVDVRHNNGGDNTLLRPLIQQLIHYQVRDPNNQLFVIIGRQTFSACQNLINRLELYANPVFVGEPTGSKPVFVGESTSVILPFSRFEGSISCYHWVDGGMFDHRQWIAPHIPVTLSAADYFAGHDPCLAAIEEICR